ncbi:MAG TPA: sigma-70 factor domain-containing protein, partial [Thermomicrobiales bacterium]
MVPSQHSDPFDQFDEVLDESQDGDDEFAVGEPIGMSNRMMPSTRYPATGSPLNGEVFDEEESLEDPLDEDLPRFDAEGATGLADERIVLDLGETADGAIAYDAMLEALPPADGEPTGVGALAQRLQELTAFVGGTEEPDEDALAEEEESGTASLGLESTNYDIGAGSLDDPVRMYLREIGRVPLLSAAREVELAAAMERGDYLAAKLAQLSTDYGQPPSADVLGRAIYHAFRQGWPHAEALYNAVHGEGTAPPKSLVLKRVLPLTQVPEEAVKQVCATFDLSPEELEESLRLRTVEWELLPPAVQALAREGAGWPPDAAVDRLFREHAARLARRWADQVEAGCRAKV